MMSYVFAAMIILSLVFGVLSGRMEEVTAAAVSSGARTVELVLSLLGTVCIWSGVMKIAEKSGLAELIGKALRPLTRIIFRGASAKAISAISLNITANLLGLGNAATPLGLIAMKELDRENGFSEEASNDMIMFVVFNTASLQLIPATAAALRAAAGSSSPMEILPAALLCSLISLVSALAAARIFSLFKGKRAESPLVLRRKPA